jgi:hypothetical protein
MGERSAHRAGSFVFQQLLTTTCLAQISLGGKQIDFGVKRKKPGTPEVKLLGPASYDSGSKLSLQFKVSNFDESKGFHVYTQLPCITSEAPEKVSEETYRSTSPSTPLRLMENARSRCSGWLRARV